MMSLPLFFMAAMNSKAYAADFTCQYTIINSNAYNAQLSLTITNNTAQPVTDWEVEVAFAGHYMLSVNEPIHAVGTNPVVFTRNKEAPLHLGVTEAYSFEVTVNSDGAAVVEPTISFCGVRNRPDDTSHALPRSNLAASSISSQPNTNNEVSASLQFSFNSDRSAIKKLHGASFTVATQIFIVAELPDATNLKNIAFFIDDAKNPVNTDRVAPFDFAGPVNSDVNAFARSYDFTNLAVGAHQIKAQLNWIDGRTQTITADINIQPANSKLVHSFKPDKLSFVALHGHTLRIGDPFFVFVDYSVEKSIERVIFKTSHGEYKVENYPSYDLQPGSNTDRALSYDTTSFSPGTHIITSVVLYRDGSTELHNATIQVLPNANDTDADGVINSLDECPATSWASSTYSNGCPITFNDCSVRANNLIQNCTFNQVIPVAWSLIQGDGSGRMSLIHREMRLAMFAQGTTVKSLQAVQNVSLLEGAYTLSFWAKTSNTRNLTVSLGSDGVNYFEEEISLTNQWVSFTFEIDNVPKDSNARLEFNLGYSGVSPVDIDNVYLGSHSASADTDGDKVNDIIDVCPSTPSGEAVNDLGCSVSQLNGDDDLDGVLNKNDLCPHTPPNRQPDAQGCTLEQSPDVDGDGLTAQQEKALGTDPTNKDTDGDTLQDGAEIALGTNPLNHDTDADKILDAADACQATPAGEAVDNVGCGASQRDSDKDGFSDAVDVLCSDTPAAEAKHVDLLGCGPSQRDSDNDGLTDAQELALGTSSLKKDTDGDGLSDAAEVNTHKTNPLLADTDADGLSDALEVRRGLNPLIKDTDSDTVADFNDTCPLSQAGANVNAQGCAIGDDDKDGIENAADACPNSAANSTVASDGCSTQERDSDNDGVADDQDAFPNDPREAYDQDNDGLGDNADTDRDGDGIDDLTEVQAGSDPDDAGSTPLNTDVLLTLFTPSQGSKITAPTTTITGELTVQTPPLTMQISINGQPAVLTSTPQNTRFVFTYELAGLEIGLNSIELVANVSFRTSDPAAPTLQQVAQRITLERIRDADIALPELRVLTPVDGAMVKGDSVVVTADYWVYSEQAELHLNGNLMTTTGTAGTLSQKVVLAAGKNSQQITLELSDGIHTQRQVITVYRDALAPVITLNTPLHPVPVVNEVTQRPYLITGTVKEANLAYFAVNDEPVDLQPTSIADELAFSVWLNPTAGIELPVSFTAVDVAGNASASTEYSITLGGNVNLEMLLPPNNITLTHTGEPIDVQVAAKATGNSDGLKALVTVSNSLGEAVVSQALEASAGVYSGFVAVPPQAGEYSLQVTLQNAQGATATQVLRTLTIVAQADVELAVQQITPASGATFIAPNKPITLAFNLPVDPTRLKVKVFETAHGKTYIRALNEPPETIVHKGFELQRVDRDYAPVAGGLAPLPGNRLMSFFPQAWLAYNADIFVEVEYDHNNDGVYQALIRSQFKTRPLPTFVTGGVVDQFGQPVAGAQITLPSLGRTTHTNSDGAFTFNFGDTPANKLPTGALAFAITRHQTDENFGNRVFERAVTAGERNALGSILLPLISAKETYTPVASGQSAKVALASSALILDVSQAQLTFEGGKSTGLLLSQFTEISAVSELLDPDFYAPWYFAAFPQGVKLSGELGLEMTLPTYEGSHAYLPQDTQGAAAKTYYMLLLATDMSNGVVVPKGVGQLVGTKVIALKHHINSLNHVGVVYIPQAYNTLVKEYLDGDLPLTGFVSTLRREIRSVRQGDKPLSMTGPQ